MLICPECGTEVEELELAAVWSEHSQVCKECREGDQRYEDEMRWSTGQTNYSDDFEPPMRTAQEQLEDRLVEAFDVSVVPTNDDAADQYWSKFDQGLLSALTNEQLEGISDWEAFVGAVYERCYDKVKDSR
jgi:hypothetical protein